MTNATRVTVRDGVLVVGLLGDIDMAIVPQVRSDIVGHLTDDLAGIIVDLSGVTYLDSQGIAMLIDLSERLHTVRGALRIAARADSMVRRLLAIAHVDIPVDASVESAIEQVKRQPQEGTRS